MTDVDTNPDFLLKNYVFDLPSEQIAKRPPAHRRDARLLVLNNEDASPKDLEFAALPTLITPNDCLILNDTSVLPARLHAEKAHSGGRVEVLLCREDSDGTWIALLNASKKVKANGRLVFHAAGGGEPFFADVVEKLEDEAGAYRLKFEGDARTYAQMFGNMPLPPYLERDDDDDDRDRYQTVFRDPLKTSSAAAPTAGLHFDPEMLATIADQGTQIAKVTLHVGPGTFLPVRDDDVREHKMHAEQWTVPEKTAAVIAQTRANGGRVIAVGTTALRALEACAQQNARVDDSGHPKRGVVKAGQGLTRLFLFPSKKFHVVDALITNFHLSESTLLMLVAAAVGRERILGAYAHAVDAGYRFFSYGDASFIEVSDEAKI